MEAFQSHVFKYWDRYNVTEISQDLIGEEPLSIRVQGKPYSVIMRTPGDEQALVAGFCLSEGIFDTPDDIISIAFCDGSDSNVVAVTLNEARRGDIDEILDRRNYISQTSCGICGKELVEDLRQKLFPLPDEPVMNIEKALFCLENLGDHQPLRQKTRAAHAAALYAFNFELLTVAEDVGRHCALDKSIGTLFLERTLFKAELAVLSSRISYELVQKAARARIAILLAVSRPTALAVELAESLNMTLGCLARGGGLNIFCGAHRLVETTEV